MWNQMIMFKEFHGNQEHYGMGVAKIGVWFRKRDNQKFKLRKKTLKWNNLWNDSFLKNINLK